MNSIEWAEEYLLSNGFTLTRQPEHVRSTPWSSVTRFATSTGYIYLKHTPELLALEAGIIQILHNQFHASVPDVIAHNAELNCFLMKDAGRPLREILKKKFDVALLCKAIDQFTSLQLAVADHINLFLDMGVLDWRLDKLPDLYRQLLSKRDLLIADGLSEIEISKLAIQLPKISMLCKKLSDFAIKQTIVQPDFHDNNLLINDRSKNITIIDLGEIVISHPFFSLINCLQQAKKHHRLKDEDEDYQQIMKACLKNYMHIESKKHLIDAFATAHTLLLVYGVLATDRLMKACGRENLMSYQPGKLSEAFKELLTACSAIDT